MSRLSHSVETGSGVPILAPGFFLPAVEAREQEACLLVKLPGQLPGQLPTELES